jgi:O-methyltransferase involved in polyketide biosynthesis
MDHKLEIELGEVQKTLLLPLWGRARDAEARYSLVHDKYAQQILSRIDVDLHAITPMPDQLQINTSVRAYNFDMAISDLLKEHPDATIINLGAGLDTTFRRLDNGQLTWYDLDLEDSMALRRQLLPESDRNIYIAKSIFDRSWFKDIEVRGSKIFFMSAGVLAYLDESDIKSLFLDLAKEFPASEIMFEIYSEAIIYYRNQRITKEEGHAISAPLKWGVDDAGKIAAWSPEIKLVEQYPFFSKVDVARYAEENGLSSFVATNNFNELKMVKLQLG